MHIVEMHDRNRDRTYVLDRATQVRAMAALIAHGALDVAPMLFAPPSPHPPRMPGVPRKRRKKDSA